MVAIARVTLIIRHGSLTIGRVKYCEVIDNQLRSQGNVSIKINRPYLNASTPDRRLEHKSKLSF